MGQRVRDGQSERECAKERNRKARERDRAIESGEARASLWEKEHRQNFKLCLWHCSHTLTSTALAWEYLKACQTLLCCNSLWSWEIKSKDKSNGKFLSSVFYFICSHSGVDENTVVSTADRKWTKVSSRGIFTAGLTRR